MSGTERDDSDVVDAELVDEPANLPATVTPALPDPDYTEAGVPSFDYVRSRIESRVTTSIGESELAGIGGKETVASLDEKLAKRDEAARDKLAEIRRQMRGE
jgi:phage shock protein A